MIIYPAIELMDGRCVTLRRGRIAEPQYWHIDPIACAKEYARAGSEWLHLVDFNAIKGDDGNRELVRDIIRQAGIPVQLAGGFRSIRQMTEWIDVGAARIVVGTLAVQNPDWVKQAAKLYPDQIVVAVDVWEGSVMIAGWTEESAIAADALIQSYELAPLAGIIIMDISASLSDHERSLALVESLAALTKSPVIASGLVHTNDELSRLKYASSISGCIIGKALLSRSVDLEEALRIAQPSPEARAEFI